MIAFAGLSPCIAAHHRRWFSSGRGGARKMSFLLGHLTRSIAPDAIRQLARNALPAPSPCLYPVPQARSHHHTRKRLALKYP
jgi:hypothetical protein